MMLWRLLRALTLTILSLVVSLYIGLYIVLNIPTVQRRVLSILNAHVFARFQTTASLQSIQLSAFPPGIILKQAKIEPRLQQSNCIQGSCTSFIQIDSLQVEIDLIESYRARIPVFTGLILEGGEIQLDTDIDGAVVLPLQIPGGPEEDRRSAPIGKAINQILPALPESLYLRNISLRQGRLDLPPQANAKTWGIVLKSATLANGRGVTDSKLSLDFSSASLSTQSKNPALKATNLDVRNLRLAATLSPEAKFSLSRLTLDSDVLSTDLRATVHLPLKVGEKPQVNAQLQLEGDLGFLMSWLEIEAAGKVVFQGDVNWKGEGWPKASGQVSWSQGAQISGYDLYTGGAKVNVSTGMISATSLAVNSKDGGHIEGSGTVLIRNGDVEIKASTSIVQLPFTTLMRGISVPTNAVAFLIDSPEANFDIAVRNNGSIFDFRVEAPIRASQLTVPSMHTATRTPIPPCQGQLKLFTDYSHLDMKDTWLSCNTDGSDKVYVNEGIVDYQSGRTRFQIDAKEISLAHAQYFLLDNPTFFVAHPTRGKADIQGTISSAGGTAPVLFEAFTKANSVSLYGVELTTLAGRWGIDPQGIWGRDLIATAGGSDKGDLRLSDMRIHFDAEVRARFAGSLQGSLAGLLSSVRDFVNSENISGQLEPSTFTVEGPLAPKTAGNSAPEPNSLAQWVEKQSPIFNWNANIIVSATNVKLPNIHIPQASVNIHCEKQACQNSKLAFIMSAPGQDMLEHSQILATIRHLSTSEVALSIRARDLSSRHLTAPGDGVEAQLSLDLEIEGSWKSYNAWLAGKIDGIRVAGIPYGAIKITGETTPGSSWDVRLSGQYGQVEGRLSMPQQFHGIGRAYLALNRFAFPALLPEHRRVALNLMGEVNAEFSAEGPAPLSRTLENASLPWYEGWKVQGTVAALNGYFKEIPFSTKGNSRLEFFQRRLTVHNLAVEGGQGERKDISLTADGTIDLRTMELASDLALQADLHLLPYLSSAFGTSTGRLSIKVKASGQIPNVSWKGEGSIQNGEVLALAVPPAFREIDMKFSFNDREIEIETLKGKKGEGSFEVTGFVDWDSMVKGKDTLPTLRLDVATQGIQSRIPIPAVQYVDTEMTSNLSLCRKSDCNQITEDAGIPEDDLLIAGNITLSDAHVTRGLECSAILNASGKSDGQATPDPSTSILNRIRLALILEAPGTLAVNTACARGRFSISSMQVEGTASQPRLFGRVETSENTGSGQLGNIRFTIENALLEFDGRYDNPRYDVQLATNVVGYGIDRQRIDYTIFIHLDDRPLNQKRNQPEIRAEPPTFPDGQRLLTQTDVVTMILTGRGPDASAPIGLSTELIANEVATAGTSAIFSEAKLEDSVSRMFNRLSAGIVDRVSIEPKFESGRPRVRLQATMIPIENLNVNVETDQDPTWSAAEARNGAITAAWIINNRINLGVDLRRRELNNGIPITMGVGTVFRFGGE